MNLAASSCEVCGKVMILCSCDKDWNTFDGILQSSCGTSVCGEKMKFSSLRVSTMTLCFKFNQSVNLKNLKNNTPIDLAINYCPDSKKSKKPKKKGSESFYNSLDIKMPFTDYYKVPEIQSNVSIMMFPNGQVKIAGCKTIRTCPMVMTELKAILKGVKGAVETPEELCIDSNKIVMICSDFEAKPNKEFSEGWCINQEIFKNILVSDYSMSATYSALNRYPGINLKYPSQVRDNKNISLLIFRSGSIIITGAAHVTELVDSYKWICGVMTKCCDSIFYFDAEEMKRKRKSR